MGAGASSSPLTDSQKAAAMVAMVEVLDNAKEGTPASQTVNRVKFAATKAINDTAPIRDSITGGISALNLDVDESASGTPSQNPHINRSNRAQTLGGLSLSFDEEVSHMIAHPSPMSRSNFRRRRLTFANRGRKSKRRDEPDQPKSVFPAGEIGETPSVASPFGPEIVGTYSCHGIEPAYDEVDRSDTVVNKINQDRGCMVYPYGNSENRARQALFAAFDGHGEVGELVSQYCMHEIQHRLELHPHFEDNIEKAFKEVFVEVDESLRGQDHIDANCSGTTAVVVLMRENRLWIANAGDSRAVVAKKNRDGLITAENLSEDQNPDHPVEQARIEAAGGFVKPPEEPGLSARVYLDAEFTQIGLAMARSLGDHAVSGVGVIACPEVTTYELSEQDEFIILASDGVWEFIDSDEAVDIVVRYIKDGAHRACENLIETAAHRWREYEGDYRDDITAVIVKVQELWPPLNGISEENQIWNDVDVSDL